MDSVAQQATASLAVLPFESLSDDSAQDYFSRGFVDDLITDLSRFPELFVFAPRTAESLGEAAPTGGAAPKVDYLLKGSIRRDADTLRLTAQLFRAEDGRVAWSGRFDTPLAELFEVQDEIVAKVVGALSSRIHANRLAQARRKATSELEVYDCWLRGFDQLRAGTLSADERAREYFNEALQRDPNFARAHLGLSLSYFNEWSCQLWSRWDDNECQAYEHASRAVALDDNDHFAHMVLGRVLLFRRQFERAEQHIDRSLTLNSNDADCLVQIAMSLAYLGRIDEARATFDRAVDLNPYHDPWYYAFGGVVAFSEENYREILTHQTRCPIDTTVDTPAYLAVAYQATEQPERAREHLDLYLELFGRKILGGRDAEPGEALRWVCHVNPFRRRADEQRLIDGLRAAASGLGLDVSTPIEPVRELRAFRQVGSLWQLSFDGRDVHLPHLKGMGDIATLLRRPNQEVHCTELMASGDASPVAGGADEAIDSSALAAYRARIEELREAVAEASTNQDEGRREAAQIELETLLEHVGRDLGIGGRPRKLKDPVERARSAVTWRIRSAIRKIDEAHEALGRHLSVAVRTGTFCSYTPERELDWRT